ncbi:Nucleoside 2-deoxyribosyltransferase [Rhodovulum sp. PH10]|uniref:nucleoside 2-deoxyribosyltransferase n=1 Tax=Rhodovulum sp. PH10 TaxID=1187851 RepID=UPI00027C2269|nr:nucleoside 2-deoxyribosyltransferase [Rhodovulum sp. PH10]EJW09569.1 Nucleoside 2-deoxyribosyltransferase [Rhodovulum sp. PH10]
MVIYLAGPDVFHPDAAEIGRRKVAMCAAAGLTGLFPLDNEPGNENEPPPRSIDIFRDNTALMDRAKAIIANLTPFRGPSADPGTVYELGFMAGRGKLCLGYSNDPRPYIDRVAEDGLRVENFGLADNLMIVHALEAFGAPIVVPRVPPADIWHDLGAFAQCVAIARDLLAESTARTRSVAGV